MRVDEVKQTYTIKGVTWKHKTTRLQYVQIKSERLKTRVPGLNGPQQQTGATLTPEAELNKQKGLEVTY